MLAALSFAGIAQADLKIPGSVFEMDELGEAKEKALASKEPLIFVYTNPNST